ALKTNCVSEVRSQKSIWRKRYLTYLSNVLIEEQDGISKERVTFLIQQGYRPFYGMEYRSSKRPPEEENFWNGVKTEKDLMDIFDKQSQIDALNVLEATRNQKSEEYVDKVNSRSSKRVKMAKGEEADTSFGHKRSYDEELPSTSSKKISTYGNEEELAEEDITQEL
ncbi:866_t:CDS:2, partial [Funneliformis mosseae]